MVAIASGGGASASVLDASGYVVARRMATVSAKITGKVREVIPGTGTSTTQGINVEVGERQAAVDVSIVADYGVAIHRLAAAIRRNVISAIEQMTGLEVTEVNVTVHDISFDDGDDTTDAAPRVQ